MTDELLPVEGISRRDLLKRGAIVGGASAMVWAAPSITTLSSRAFGTTGTELTGWSFAAFIVVCSGTEYRAKWNRETGFEQGEELPSCQNVQPFYDDYQDALEGGPFTVNPPTQSGSIVTFTITSETCVIKNGVEAGVAKEATKCEAAGTVSTDGKSISFDVAIFE